MAAALGSWSCGRATVAVCFHEEAALSQALPDRRRCSRLRMALPAMLPSALVTGGHPRRTLGSDRPRRCYLQSELEGSGKRSQPSQTTGNACPEKGAGKSGTSPNPLHLPAGFPRQSFLPSCVVQGVIDLAGEPEPMQEDAEFARHGRDGTTLGVLSASAREFRSPALQV